MSAESTKNFNAAILLTPPGGTGGSAIAVVRLRGPMTCQFLERHFSKPLVAASPVHGALRDGEHIIDDPLVVLSPDGSWADLNLHGGQSVIAATLELAQREGFEFLDTHVASGNPIPDFALDEVESILKREVIAHLPLARTAEAIRALLDQPRAWGDAQESEIDIARILADRSLWLMLHPAQVALVGEPNVGKSTLANQLFGRERSITADVPGTTRDWVGEIANIDGLAVVLVDTPGIRDTGDPLEGAAIDAASRKIRESDLVVRVLDSSTKSSMSLHQNAGLVVVNKIDAQRAWDYETALSHPVCVSAKTGLGIGQLRLRIKKHFGLEAQWKPRPCWWTDRQRELLAQYCAQQLSFNELSRAMR